MGAGYFVCANFLRPRQPRLALHVVGVAYFEKDLKQIVERIFLPRIYVAFLRRVGELAYIK